MNGVKGMKTDNPIYVSLPEDPQAYNTLRRANDNNNEGLRMARMARVV